MGERGVSRHVGVRFEDVAADGSFVERDSSPDPNLGRATARKSSGKDRKKDAEKASSTNRMGESTNGETLPENGGKKAPGKVVAGEVLMDMEAASDTPEVGGRTKPTENEMEMEG